MLRKSRYKPFYKQFLRLKKNVQNSPKLLKFKRQKWKKFQQYLRNQLRIFKRFKIKDQFQLSVSKFASKGNSFQRKFRENLYEQKVFNLFYGKLKRNYLKKRILIALKVKPTTDYRHRLLKLLESRLDIVLYRANFSLTIASARQYILHGYIFVNGISVKTKSYMLKENDLIEIHHDLKKRRLIRENLAKSNFWPIPPKHLIINYRTLQILFSYTTTANFMPIFNQYISLNSLPMSIKKL